MSLSWENRDILSDQGDMTILTYFTCMVKIVALLIFNKVMQSMFLAFLFFFFFRGNNT